MRNLQYTFTLFLAVLAMATAASHAADNLTRSEIRAQILDRPFKYRGFENGQKREGRIFYKSNGKMFILTRQGIVDGGTWRIQGHRFCTRVRLGRNNRKTCFSIGKKKFGRYKTDHGYTLRPIVDRRFVGV